MQTLKLNAHCDGLKAEQHAVKACMEDSTIGPGMQECIAKSTHDAMPTIDTLDTDAACACVLEAPLPLLKCPSWVWTLPGAIWPIVQSDSRVLLGSCRPQASAWLSLLQTH